MEKKTEYTQQAFPVCDMEVTHNGMTLLDYMAAKIAQGYLANPDNTTEFRRMHLTNEIEYAVVAKGAYEQAAAMLEERKKYINS